jgi:hypothetical protein
MRQARHSMVVDGAAEIVSVSPQRAHEDPL